MRNQWVHRLILGAAAMGLVFGPFVFAPREAGASSLLMQRLPAYNKYRCALCHTSSAPKVGDAALNAFGQDFVANGGFWDERLAQKNSDGDRCTNGFELGDRNGDGVFDNPGGQWLENGNPGDPNDCTVPVDATTWGIIKNMFHSELQQFSGTDLGLLEEFLMYYP